MHCHNLINVSYLLFKRIRLFYVSLHYPNNKGIKMDSNSADYGKKGSCFGKFFLYFGLFIILLVWVYWRNQNGLG